MKKKKKKRFCLICIKKQMSSFIPKQKLNSFHFVLHYPYNIRWNLDNIIHVFNLWINLEAGVFQHGKQIRNELCNILMKFITLIISWKFYFSIVYIPEQLQIKLYHMQYCRLVSCSWLCVHSQSSYALGGSPSGYLVMQITA